MPRLHRQRRQRQQQGHRQKQGHSKAPSQAAASSRSCVLPRCWPVMRGWGGTRAALWVAAQAAAWGPPRYWVAPCWAAVMQGEAAAAAGALSAVRLSCSRIQRATRASAAVCLRAEQPDPNESMPVDGIALRCSQQRDAVAPPWGQGGRSASHPAAINGPAGCGGPLDGPGRGDRKESLPAGAGSPLLLEGV